MKKTLAVFFPAFLLSAMINAESHNMSSMYDSSNPLPELLSATVKTSVNDYPFSDIINWGDDSRQRKDYEKYLRKGGVAFASIAIVYQDGKMKIADSEEFILVKKGNAVIGYGIILTNLKLSGYAVNKKKNDIREIVINKVEIFYDLSERHIFLVSYKTKGLSDFEMWMAKKMGHKPKAVRRDIDINNLDLGEGYEFDEKSQALARFLLNFPKICKEFFDKNGFQDGKLTVPIGEEVIKGFSR